MMFFYLRFHWFRQLIIFTFGSFSALSRTQRSLETALTLPGLGTHGGWTPPARSPSCGRRPSLPAPRPSSWWARLERDSTAVHRWWKTATVHLQSGQVGSPSRFPRYRRFLRRPHVAEPEPAPQVVLPGSTPWWLWRWCVPCWCPECR